MQHPNILDQLAVFIFPRYLYHGQTAVLVAPVATTILHKSTGDWRQTDSLVLKKGGQIRFLGLAKNLKVLDKDQKDFSIFEIVNAYAKENSSKVISPGDTIVITPRDRQFVHPLPKQV